MFVCEEGTRRPWDPAKVRTVCSYALHRQAVNAFLSLTLQPHVSRKTPHEIVCMKECHLLVNID